MARQEQMQNDTMNFDPFFNPNNAANVSDKLNICFLLISFLS